MFSHNARAENNRSAPLGDRYSEQWKALSAWFLGPRAENSDVFLETFQDIFKEHVRMRNNYFPSDPTYITQEMKSSQPYKSEIENMKRELMRMQREMDQNIRFSSPRYLAHMQWDLSMPALLGYMSAMLFNQNNVDISGSPVTTLYEKQVGQQLCGMLGYNIFPGKKEPVAWGHVTCGGSISNIEALWASRNIKFEPLAVKAALLNDDPKAGAPAFLSEEQIRVGLKTNLLVYSQDSQMRKLTPLKNCTTWQLLNVDVDEICDLTENVIARMNRISEFAKKKFQDLVDGERIASLGLPGILKKHNIDQVPVYTVPANNHYSWSKAGTLLGLGSNALHPIQLDINFRQDVDHLREVLEKFLENEIPVISVVAAMGSTEESAVDPIMETYALREEFKEKGLNFTLLADGAWGGYLKTMIIDNPTTDIIPDEGRLLRESNKMKFEGFVPYCELSPYVQKQYGNIQLADAISIDPHKTGFCPYPGGSLCYRNEKMRFFVAVYHPEVFYGEGDPSMGLYGIEGSKPGASPAGILMSHNVIGLGNRGYGRILGQGTATAKLFYSMWLTVAREDDPFVCVPLQNVPDSFDYTSARKLIREKIAHKPTMEVFRDPDAVNFLTLCGPDTMINTFVVNFRGNDNVEKSNKLQVALGDAMSIRLGTKVSRIPLMIMQTSFDAKSHGLGLRVLKKRAGLRQDDTDLNVLVNTCMNAWRQNESISEIGDLFRKIVFNCMGRIEDSVIKHRFVLSGPFDDKARDQSMFIEYLTDSDFQEHQYQVSVKVEANCPTDGEKLKEYVKLCSDKDIMVVFETVPPRYNDSDKDIPNLYNILHLNNWNRRFSVKLANDPEGRIISLKVLDIPRYQRLDMSASVDYPEKQQYFIYGDTHRTIMSHVITKLPDIQHTVTLTERPHSLTEVMLEQGVVAELVDRGVVEKVDEGVAEKVDEGVVEMVDEGAVEKVDQGVVDNVDQGVVEKVDEGVLEKVEGSVVEKVDQGAVEKVDQGVAENVDEGVAEKVYQEVVGKVDEGVVKKVDQGVMEKVERSPLVLGEEFTQPLQRKCYEATFVGERNARIYTNVHIAETRIFKIVQLPAV
ncbi:hypothetical protein ACHWQZ_G018814 [Mnemiopsis leidyi]